jgi:hypothetical protein
MHPTRLPSIDDAGPGVAEQRVPLALEGVELIERISAGQWAVGWARGDDDRWPCFLEERQAISWMRDRLSRGRVFV